MAGCLANSTSCASALSAASIGSMRPNMVMRAQVGSCRVVVARMVVVSLSATHASQPSPGLSCAGIQDDQQAGAGGGSWCR